MSKCFKYFIFIQKSAYSKPLPNLECQRINLFLLGRFVVSKGRTIIFLEGGGVRNIEKNMFAGPEKTK